MNGVVAHGWRAPLIVNTTEEMYGRILSSFLPSMGFFHSWMVDIHGWNTAAIIKTIPFYRLELKDELNRRPEG